MHIFNVSITTVQGLKNVSLKAWEELITQSRYPIKDARPPGIHHSISRMHFVQPGQKWCKQSCNVELSVFPGPALEGYMYVSLATHPYQFFTTLDRCLIMHITVNMHHSVTVGHVQHAELGHIAESKQYGGLKNVTTEYQT